jgi:hypothetical protein
MSDLLQVLSNFQETAALLAAVFLVVVLVATMTFILTRRNSDLAIRLLGSLMILALALAANTVWLYGIAVFIVATLVTELDFLEKFIAIVWNRKEYWDYRISSATPKELQRKRAVEVLELTRPQLLGETTHTERSRQSRDADNADSVRLSRTVSHRALLEKVKNFENAVVETLKSGVGPFSGSRVRAPVRVQTSSRRTTILDAVIERPDTHFVVEVKFLRSPRLPEPMIHQVLGVTEVYREAVFVKGQPVHVVPLLVVPAETGLPTMDSGILIAQFEFESKRFTNLDELGSALEVLGQEG